MSSQELKAAGERLYGRFWRQPLATALDIDVATLRRWASGKAKIPRSAELAIAFLVERVDKVV